MGQYKEREKEGNKKGTTWNHCRVLFYSRLPSFYLFTWYIYWHRKMSISHTFWRPSFSFSFLFFSFFSSERSLHWCNFPMLFQPKARFFAISCHSILGSVARTNFSVWSVQRSTATGGVCGNTWIFSAKWNHFILALIARTELGYPLYSSTMFCANTELARQCRKSISVSRCPCYFLLWIRDRCASPLWKKIQMVWFEIERILWINCCCCCCCWRCHDL